MIQKHFSLFFFYFFFSAFHASDSDGSLDTRTATIQSHGKTIGSIKKTTHTKKNITTTHVQIFSTKKNLTFERIVETHGFQLLKMNTINHEFQTASYVEKINNEYFISHHKNHNDRKKLDTDTRQIISTDSLSLFIQSHWDEIIKEEKIKISMISIPSEKVIDLTIKYRGQKKGEKKTYLEMEIIPDSFFVQTMMQTLGIHSYIYLNPHNKMIMISHGPMFNTPGHNPSDELPETSVKITWNPNDS